HALRDRGIELPSSPGAILSLESTWVVASRARPGNAAGYALAGGTHRPLYVDDPQLLQVQLTAALLRGTRRFGYSLHTALAADVFNPGQVLDDVYMPMFLPQSRGRWPGNLKKLKLRRSQETADDAGTSPEPLGQLIDA